MHLGEDKIHESCSVMQLIYWYLHGVKSAIVVTVGNLSENSGHCQKKPLGDSCCSGGTAEQVCSSPPSQYEGKEGRSRRHRKPNYSTQ